MARRDQFDLPPRVIVGQPQLEAVCEFVRLIGTTLQRSVVVCYEFLPRDEADAMGNAIMRYEPETDRIVRVLHPKSWYE